MDSSGCFCSSHKLPVSRGQFCCCRFYGWWFLALPAAYGDVSASTPLYIWPMPAVNVRGLCRMMFPYFGDISGAAGFLSSAAGLSGDANCLRRCRLGFLSGTTGFSGAASCLRRRRLSFLSGAVGVCRRQLLTALPYRLSLQRRWMFWRCKVLTAL